MNYRKFFQAGFPTCTIREVLKRPCSFMKLEEEKWNRRVEALDTAIGLYLDSPHRSLVPPNNRVIRKGASMCSTKYTGARLL